MANTLVQGKNGFSVTLDGSTNFDSADHYTNGRGIAVESLEMKPTATDDAIIVKEDDASGRIIFSEVSANAYDNKIKYFNTEDGKKRINLFITGTDVDAGVILIVELKE